MTGSKKMKALIQWIGGRDHGTLAIIDVSWIKDKDFNVETWKATPPNKRPESEDVEWRVGKKPESGCYSCFDAQILSISSKTKTLETEKNALEANKKEHEREAKMEQGSVAKANERDDKPKESDLNTVAANKRTSGNGALSHSDDSSESSEEETPAPKDPRQAKNKADHHIFHKLENQNIRPKDMTGKNSKSSKGKPDTSNKVPIHKGSPYLVDAVQYEHNRLLSCTNFVTAMLHQLFRSDVLVVSNLKGGKSTINQKDHFRRWALDRKKRLAIITAARHLFPSEKVSGINRLIMSHINLLRFSLKKKGNLAKYEEKGKKKMTGKPHSLDSEEEASASSNE